MFILWGGIFLTPASSDERSRVEMKRCIICGNVGDENSTVCDVCGGSFVDMAEDTVEDASNEVSKSGDEAVEQIAKQLEKMLQYPMEDEKTDEEDELAQQLADILEGDLPADVETQDSDARTVQENSDELTAKSNEEAEEVTAQADAEAVSEEEDLSGKGAEEKSEAQISQMGRQPRRMKSEPQIYGQTQMGDSAAAYRGQQGMVRRNLQGRPANGMQGQPMNGAPQGRPANGMQRQPMNGAPQGRPVNGMQGQPMNGAPQGRPVNGVQGQPMNGAPQGRPVNGMQGQPMNRVPQGRPMNGMQGQPTNGTPQGRYTRAIMETARKSMKSPMFFLIVLLNTVYLAGAIAAIFMKQLNYSQFGRLLTGMELPSQLTGYMDELMNLLMKLDTSAVGVNIVLHIPHILFCLGLWAIFFAAVGAKEKMSGVGFSFIKIVVIFNMIVKCVVLLAGLIVSVTLVVAAWASGTKSMIVGSVITMVLMIMITMLIIMYYFCYLGTIKTCRLNAKSGESYGKASAYVALVSIVGALTAVVNLLSGIVNLEISNIASAAGKMGWMILFGLWIFSYRKKMKQFAE